MSDQKRYSISGITCKRLFHAINTRINEIPHTFAWNHSQSARENKKRIADFEGIHKGKRCFILANGPSLTRTNLDLLTNEITFGLNRIYLHFKNSSFRPTYYVAVNELVLEQYSEEISALKMPKFINWNKRAYFNIHDPSCIFLKTRLVFRDDFSYDLSQPMVFGGTVTFTTLQLAYFMGFRQVVLVGLDHNYVEKGTPNTIEKRQLEFDRSHFHPEYFPKGSKWQLPDLVRSEVDYRIAREYYEKDGREIIDATIDGKCTIFKKMQLETLF